MRRGGGGRRGACEKNHSGGKGKSMKKKNDIVEYIGTASIITGCVLLPMPIGMPSS